MTTREMQADARRFAKGRGHKVGEWHKSDLGGYYATCGGCGRCLVVTPLPNPDEINLAGEAVAVTCTGPQ